MKATAKAPANIAFIKYWGKRDKKLRLPMNSSISMNLSGAFTRTSVELDRKLNKDSLKIDGEDARGREKDRVIKHLDRIRALAEIETKTRVESKNSFPKGTGIASSASGFAALTLAATKAAGLDLSEKELSILARLGSGSACRSIPDGFVEWKMGYKSKTSYAYSLYPPDYWDIADLIAVVGEKTKKVSSTTGHASAESSPFYNTRIKGMKDKVKEIKAAMAKKDFNKFGEIIEAESISMHAVMMTSRPPLYYWAPKTLEIILAVNEWRNKGLESYFTLDAGANVHVICKQSFSSKLKILLEKIGVDRVIVNRPSRGAHLIKLPYE